MTSLSFDINSSPKPTYSSLMDAVDPLSPWPYVTTFSNNATVNDAAITNNDSLGILQQYEISQWTHPSETWQTMLDDWIPASGSAYEQKPDLQNVPSMSLPPTPPSHTPTSSIDMDYLDSLSPSNTATATKDIIPLLLSNNMAPFGPDSTSAMFTNSTSAPTIMGSPSVTSYSPSSSPISSVLSLSPPLTSSLSTPLSSLSSTNANNNYLRRCSENPRPRANTRPYRRRALSHPSVASVVSLSAHEPTSKLIGGVEYITFLYSHERLVKEYTVRTDVDTVDVDIIPMDFKAQNTIYPRANVERKKYDGNRWNYETTCNMLGWKLCWLNQAQLCGHRGLIQRAVDSYRNRHAEMHSRRVARQQKVANGTLRKRKSKKSMVSLST